VRYPQPEMIDRSSRSSARANATWDWHHWRSWEARAGDEAHWRWDGCTRETPWSSWQGKARCRVTAQTRGTRRRVGLKSHGYWRSGRRGWWWPVPREQGAKPQEAADEAVIWEPEEVHRCTIVWLHSCHGRAWHAEHLAEDLRSRGLLKNARLLAPSSPKRSPEDSHQWFEYCSTGLETGADQDDANVSQLREQRTALLALLEKEVRRLPPDGRLLIGGLSQGASMALDLLLHIRSGPVLEKLQGIIAQRGMLQRESIDDLKLTAHSNEGTKQVGHLAGMPVLATHGMADDLVPIEAARRSYDFLVGLGTSFKLHELPGLYHTGRSWEEADSIAAHIELMLHGSPP